jgi:hypothetical protein
MAAVEHAAAVVAEHAAEAVAEHAGAVAAVEHVEAATSIANRLHAA